MSIKLKYSTLGLFSLLILLNACRKHDYYQENPNQPSAATPALMLTNICISVSNYDPTAPAYASRQLTYYERGNSSVDYSWTNASFANFDKLRQVKTMQELASSTGEQNYLGLAKFFRAVLYSQMTETFGDIPYSQ